MQGHHAGYAGLLKYLSNEFRSLAKGPGADGRFLIYANVIERIATDLMASESEQFDQTESVGKTHAA